MGRRASRRFGALSLNLGGGRGLNSGPRLLSSIATSPSSATEGTPTALRPMSRWSHCPPSSATAEGSPAPLSSQPSQMRTRATTGPLATQGRRAVVARGHTRTRPAHQDRRTRSRSARRKRPKPPRRKRPKPCHRQTRTPRK